MNLFINTIVLIFAVIFVYIITDSEILVTNFNGKSKLDEIIKQLKNENMTIFDRKVFNVYINDWKTKRITNNLFIIFLLQLSAQLGKLNILKDLNNNINYDYFLKHVESIYVYAAKGGQLEIIKWLHTNNYGNYCYYGAYYYAIENNHFETVKLLYKNKCSGSNSICSYATQFNQVKILKWANDPQNNICITNI